MNAGSVVKTQAEADALPEITAEYPMKELNHGVVLTGALGMVVWVLIIPWLGFAVTSVLALIALSIALGKRTDRTPVKLISTAGVTLVIVSIIYYFFTAFMEVQLPRGILF